MSETREERLARIHVARDRLEWAMTEDHEEIKAAVGAALEYIDWLLSQVPRWIPVYEPPKDGRDVLVRVNLAGEGYDPEYKTVIGSLTYGVWSIEGLTATHWMPLPPEVG